MPVSGIGPVAPLRGAGGRVAYFSAAKLRAGSCTWARAPSNWMVTAPTGEAAGGGAESGSFTGGPSLNCSRSPWKRWPLPDAVSAPSAEYQTGRPSSA